MEQGVVPDLAAEGFAEVAAENSAEIAAEVIAEIAVEIAAEVLVQVVAEILVVRLDWGVKNFIYRYMVVQAGSGFDVDTGAALCSTVAGG